MLKTTAQQFPRWEPDRAVGVRNPEIGAWSCLGNTQLGRRCRRPLSNTARDEVILILPKLGRGHPAAPEEEETYLRSIIEACLCHDHNDQETAEAVCQRVRLTLRRVRTQMELLQDEIVVEEAEYADGEPGSSSNSSEPADDEILDPPKIAHHLSTLSPIVTEGSSRGKGPDPNVLPPSGPIRAGEQPARSSMPLNGSALGTSSSSPSHEPRSPLDTLPEERRQLRNDQGDEFKGEYTSRERRPTPPRSSVVSGILGHTKVLNSSDEASLTAGIQSDVQISPRENQSTLNTIRKEEDDELLELVARFRTLGKTMDDEGDDGASTVGNDILSMCKALGIKTSTLYQVTAENPNASGHSLIRLLRQEDLTVATSPLQQVTAPGAPRQSLESVTSSKNESD